MPSLDSFQSRRTLDVNGKTYTYYSLQAAAENGLGDISRSTSFAESPSWRTC